MDTTDTVRILNTMIEYFEAGNRESDYTAKSIVESDFDAAEYWKKRINQIRDGARWTGLRTIEAEIILSALHIAKVNLETET